MLTTPILVLVSTDEAGAPTHASRELVTTARALTSGEVVALSLAPLGQAASVLAGDGATRALEAPALSERAKVASVAGEALVAGARAAGAALILVPSDYHGKEAGGYAASLLGSAIAVDVSDVSADGDTRLTASRLVLSGSWNATIAVEVDAQRPAVVAVHTGALELAASGSGDLPVSELSVDLSAGASAVRVLRREVSAHGSGPELTEARTVVVGGRGVDGDFDLVRSLTTPLNAAVGATRVACDEGWIERTAQVGQTGVSISPRLYIGLGVSGAIHHTSGIQGAQRIVAIVDDSEAPLLQMADYGVVGDVTTVVPQLVQELARLKG